LAQPVWRINLAFETTGYSVRLAMVKPVFKSILTTALFSVLTISAQGQDPHFTLYNMSPQTLNPSQTGAFRGTLKTGALYRNQWRSIDASSFRTITGFASRKFVAGSDYVALGLMGTNDQSGPGNYQFNQAAFTGAYHKKMGRHVLRGGLQAGLINNSINDVTFPAQYDNDIGGFDPDLPDQEGRIASNTAYFDLNTGISWQFRLASWRFTVGQAFYHINQPDASLVRGYEWQLAPRYVSHARAHIPLSNTVGLQPSAVFKQQNQATEFLIGSMVRIGSRGDPLNFRVGSYYRDNLTGYGSRDLTEDVDALSINAGASIRSFDIGVAYDLNLSDLQRATDYRGAFEVALTYTYGFSEQPAKKTVPCYRY
jgi:type IX secretion system PorP/SprF family membrane protein